MSKSEIYRKRVLKGDRPVEDTKPEELPYFEDEGGFKYYYDKEVDAKIASLTADNARLYNENIAKDITITGLRAMVYRNREALDSFAGELNRRVTVEQYLLNCAGGSSPLPDADKCIELALKLGVPESFKQHKE